MKTLGYEWPGAYFVGAEELELVTKVVRAKSPFRYYGLDCQHMTDRLEKEFAGYTGSRYALAVSSGTSALNVALAALGVGPGQEVIVPGYMWVSTVAAVVNRGAIPVLAEIDDSFCLDPKDLKRKITPRTTVVIPVHMSGAPGNILEVCAISRRYNLKIVEDCAQACGASYHKKKIGTFGDIGCFSFQYNKAMTTGEGGMVITNDELFYKRSLAAHDIGHSRNLAGRLVVDPKVLLWGLGTRMSELQAAFGLAQLRKLNKITDAMRTAKYKIRTAVSNLPGITLRRMDDPKGDNGSFLITSYPTPEKAKRMSERLKILGVQAGPDSLLLCYFEQWGFHLYYNMPALVKKASTSPDGFPWTHPLNKNSVYEYDKGSLPRTDDLFSRSVIQAIPSNSRAKNAAMIIKAYRTAAKEILK
ncbi:MAG: DegT/DnrJ/EryC1/StrS family aminotransferase [Candidatus Omnitrophota bacterium]